MNPTINLFIIFLFISSSLTLEYSNEEIGSKITIDTSKVRKTYKSPEDIEMDEIKANVTYKIDDEIIKDFYLEFDPYNNALITEIGNEKVTLLHFNIVDNFKLNLCENDLSLFKIEKAKKVFKGVKDGGYRGEQEKLFFNSDNYNPTNEWGFEIQINENYEVVAKDRNVAMLKNGYIFSGHSDAGYELRDNIDIGDYVIYISESRTAYVFENKKEYKNAYYIFKINNMLTLLKNKMNEEKVNSEFLDKLYELNDEYKDICFESNETIIDLYKKINEFYEDEMEVSKVDLSKFEYKNTLKLNDFVYQELYTDKKSISSENLIVTFKVTHEGGFRDTNELVKYDESNLEDRNIYGFEAAIDKNGNVINKGTVIDLPKDGYLLSGHGNSIGTINNNLQIGDYIVYEKLKVSVYRNINTNIINNLGSNINKLINTFNEIQKKSVPLYYDEIIKRLNKLINLYNLMDQDLSFNIQTYKYLKDLNTDSLILQVKFLFIESTPVQIQAMWHTPNMLSNYYDETKVKGVQKFLKEAKEMGFNRIYLETNSVGTSYYNSKILNPHWQFGKPYDEYKDYLECFLAEAHKLNIEVITWVQVLRAKDSWAETPKVYKEEWLSIDYNGKQCTFFDSINPEVHEFLLKQLSELALYDVDGIEYDYIRYEYSNILSNPSSIIDYGYTPVGIKMFKEKYKYDEEKDIKEILKDGKARQNWVEFKKQRITDLLTKAKNEIRTIKPNCILTAAVFSGPSAPDTIMQDWPKWLSAGIVDYVEPMIYEKDSKYFIESRVPDCLSMVTNNEEEKKNKVIIGIGPMVEGGNYLEYFDQIRYVLDLQHSYTIFSSYLSMNFRKYVEVLRNYNYAPISYTADIEDKIRVLVPDLIKKIKQYYSKIIDYDFIDLLNALNKCLEDSKEKNINKVFDIIEEIDDENVKNNIYNIFMKVHSKYEIE